MIQRGIPTSITSPNLETSSSFTSLASDSNSPQVSRKNLDNDSIEETPDETAVNPWENDMNDKELQIIGKRTAFIVIQLYSLADVIKN